MANSITDIYKASDLIKQACPSLHEEWERTLYAEMHEHYTAMGENSPHALVILLTDVREGEGFIAVEDVGKGVFFNLLKADKATGVANEVLATWYLDFDNAVMRRVELHQVKTLH